MPGDVPLRRALASLVGLVGCTVVLHAAHVAGGHAWFSAYGPVIAVALTAVVIIVLGARHDSQGLGMFAALLAILVVPEWLEGELAAGHRLDWRTLETHGIATAGVLALSAGTAMLWEAARLLALIWPR